MLAICMVVGGNTVYPAVDSEAQGESVVSETAAQEDLQTYSASYFGDQLTEPAEQVFYAAFEEMYRNGDFKSGQAAHEIPVGDGEGKLSTDLLEGYMNGDASLAQMFQNASNAFMFDCNDLFYIDWTKLSMRIGQDSSGWKVVVGNGAYENLYADNPYYDSEEKIEAAIAQMDQRIADITQGAAAAGSDEESKIGYVHDRLIQDIEYVFRGTTDVPGDTAAGALLMDEAWCEGYARAFKAVMDRMGIPCVLVGGSGLPEAGANGESLMSPEVEAHMWNYVKLKNGKWYAVDVTYDDPITETSSGTIKQDCLLRGSLNFSERHIENGQLSQGGRAFQYPALNTVDVGQGGSEAEGLTVNVSYFDNFNTSEQEWTSYTKVQPVYTDAEGESYAGMEIDATQKYYLVYRNVQKLDSTPDGAVTYSNWSPAKMLFDMQGGDGTFTQAYVTEYSGWGQILGYQFAVIDMPASLLGVPEGANFLATAEPTFFRDRYKATVVSRPGIVERTPNTTTGITTSSEHVRFVYDVPLKLADGYTEASIKVSTSLSGPTYRVENLTWKNTTRIGFDGTEQECCVVEFDFYPDTSYNYSGTSYTFSFEGLVSSINDSEPRSASLRWRSTQVNRYPCPQQPAPSAMLLSMQPQLLQNTFSPDMFTDPMGNLISDTMDNSLNIALIASKPSSSEQDKIDDALAAEGVQPVEGEQGMESATYSLDLGCRAMRTYLNNRSENGGVKLSIALPYPHGFDSRTMEGVTFEAYHFVKNADGTYTAEKLICNATDTGIWIIAESFSPFMVVAVADEDHDAEGMKKISAVTNSDMAEVTVSKGEGSAETVLPELATLQEGESCTYTFQPKEGYQLEQVIWNGEEQEAAANEDGSYSVTYTYEDLTEESNSLLVNFCSASVLEAEEEAGIEAQNPVGFTGGMPDNNGQAQMPESTGEETYSATSMELGKTITAEMEDISSVKLNASDLKMKAGTTSTLIVTEGSTEEDEWLSSNETVASVSDGVVTAKEAGVSYISIQNSLGSAVCKVEVIAEEVIEVESITFEPTSVELTVGGDPVALTATIVPENATNKSIAWSNTNPEVARLQDNKIIPMKAGKTTIIATAPNGKTAACEVTVLPKPVTGISLNTANLSLKAGETATLTASIEPEDAGDKTVTWTSDHSNIAVVEDGVVTAVAPGTAAITATASNGMTASCQVTVTAVEVTEITLSADTLELEAGESATLTAAIAPANATDKTVTWSSSRTDIATVTDGVVTAVAAGTATITAKAGGKEAACVVKVTQKASGFTVTVENGMITNKGNTASAQFASRDIARVSPTAPDGEAKFAYWKNQVSGAIVSYDENYAFVVTNDVTLAAVFSEEEVTEAPVATLEPVGAVTETSAGKYRLSYSCNAYVPEGYTILERGLLLTNKNTADSDAFKLDGTLTPISKMEMTPQKGQYVVNVNNVKSGQVRTGRAYVRYTDKEGQEGTAYSDVILPLTTP